jgi:hypothetical protein
MSFMYKYFLLLLSLSSPYLVAQTIRGKVLKQANQSIKLEGFNGLKTYPISSTKFDDKGNFKLPYSKVD